MNNSIEHIRLLNSNKFSMKEKTLLFIGILSTTICDKNLFKRNSELKEYIKLYENVIKTKPYRDYLFHSRTLLSSRMIRDFMNIDDSFIIKECFRVHVDFMENSEEFIKNNKEIKDEKKIIKNSLLTDMINRGKERE